MPEAKLERDAEAGEETARAPQALLAADVVAIHVAAEESEPDLATARVEVATLLRRPLGEDSGELFVAVLDGPAPAELRSRCADLRSLLRERLAVLSSAERAEVLELLGEAANAEPAPQDLVGLSTSRALAREALRDPLPPTAVERDEPQGLHFDSVLALDDDAFYVRGWARDGQAPLTRLTVVTPEGSRIELLPGIYREPRPDVDSFYEEPTRTGAEGTGFLGHCESGAPSLLSDGWVLEMENALGVAREVP